MGGYFPRLAFTRHCSILKTRMSTKLLVFVALVTGARSTRSQEAQLALANPIRKVVTMLQSMQTKVQEEGEKELALYEKYMCYCKNAGGDLQASIASAGDSISELGNKIKAGEEQMVVLKEELKTAQEDRATAKAAMAEATAIREKRQLQTKISQLLQRLWLLWKKGWQEHSCKQMRHRFSEVLLRAREI